MRRFTPITEVVHKGEHCWDNGLLCVFHQADVIGEDAFTYTFRINADEADQPALREKLIALGAEDLVQLLEDNDWDVSFLVDTF